MNIWTTGIALNSAPSASQTVSVLGLDYYSLTKASSRVKSNRC